MDFEEAVRGLLQTPPPPEVQEKANTRKDVRRKPKKTLGRGWGEFVSDVPVVRALRAAVADGSLTVC